MRDKPLVHVMSIAINIYFIGNYYLRFMCWVEFVLPCVRNNINIDRCMNDVQILFDDKSYTFQNLQQQKQID